MKHRQISISKLLFIAVILAMLLPAIPVAQAETRTTYTFQGVTNPTPNTVRDNFSTRVYNRNDGTVNWSGSWTESGDSGTSQSPTSGQIQVTTSGTLQIGDGISGTPSISRSANLSGNTLAVLTFDYDTNNQLENGDYLYVEVYNGSSWTELERYENDVSGTGNFDISDYISANTAVRFRVDTDSNEYWYVDNVQIAFSSPCGPGDVCARASDVDQFPYTAAGDRNTFVAATNAEYSAISADDANRWATVDPDDNDQIFVQFDMAVAETVSSITQIDFTFVGNTDGDFWGWPLTTEHRIYVKRWDMGDTESGAWIQVGDGQEITADTDSEMIRSLTSNFASYINPTTGAITWGVYETRSSEDMRINYAGMTVTANLAPNKPALVSPAANGYVNIRRPEFSWNTVTDPDDPAAELSYFILIDSSEISVGTNLSSFTPTSDLSEGPHHWCVRAYDGLLYSSEWSAANCRDFIIDIDTPATPAYLREGSPTEPDQDFYPNTNYSLTIYWGSVPDTGSGISYELYRRVNGAVSWGSPITTTTNTSFLDTGTFADNDFIEYQVRARTGALTYGSSQFSDGVRIDSQTPATVTGVGEGVLVGTDDAWSNNNAYYVYWNRIADTGSGITYEVQRSVNLGAFTTFTLSGLACDPSRCWGDDPTGYSNGDFVRYQVRATNGAGRSGLYSAISSGIRIDLGAPDSSVTTGGVFRAATWPGQIAGTASDAGGSGVARVDIRIRDATSGQYWNGTTLAWQAAEAWVQASGTTAWSYSFPAARLTDGHTYVVDSQATDGAGNVETTFGNNNFTYSSTAPDAPAPVSTSHPNPALWYNDNQPSFTWNEPSSSVDVQGYSIILDPYPGTIPDTIQDTTDLAYDAATTPDGVWYFHVRAVNIAGSWGPAGHVRVNIDTTIPQAPAGVTENSPDVDYDADGAVTVHWSAVNNTGSGITYRLEKELNNSGTWSFVISSTTTSVADTGTYADGTIIHYRVRATNGVGLSSAYTSSDGMTIDNQTPGTSAGVFEDATSLPDRDFHSSANGAVSVNWDAVTNTGSGITYELRRQITPPGGPTGAWTLIASGLTGTTYNDSGSYGDGYRIAYRVTAINGVGTAGGTRDSNGFLIDTGIPALPAWVREGVNTEPDWDYDGDGAFPVHWATVADTGSGITYKLEKSVDDGPWTLVAEDIANSPYADADTYTDGATIRYRVAPVNGAGTAGAYRLSDGITIDLETPDAPASVTENSPDVDYDADGAVTVYWNAVANTGSGITYDLQKRVNGGAWANVATNLTVTSRADSGAYNDNDRIEYQVLARNGVGRTSAWTLSDGVRVDTGTPGTPTNVGEGDSVNTDDDFDEDNTFFVYWTGVTSTATDDQIYYTIERNVNGGGWENAAAGVTATSWEDPRVYSNGDSVRYRITAVNGAGRSGSASDASDGILVDTGRPNSVIATSGYYNAVSWPDRIEGTATDDYSDVFRVEVTIFDSDAGLWWNGSGWAGGGPFWLVATGTINWTYALTDANLTNGHAYNLQSRATDLAGNVEPEASYGTNTFIFADSGPEAPVVSSSTHSSQTTWYNQNDPAFTWTIPGGPAPIVGYSFILDQNLGTTPDAVADTTGNSASFIDRSSGIWYFHVRALDNAGTWGPAGHYQVNIDTATPSAPASVTEETPDVDWDFDGSVTVYWTAVPDTGSGIVYSVERQIGSGTWTVISDTVATTSLLDPNTGYADGTVIRYRVSARNGVNLTGLTTQSDSFTVDNDTPNTPAWVTENAPDPNDQDYDPDGSVSVHWAASNDTGSGLTYRLERRITVNGIPGSWVQIASGLQVTSYLDPRANQDGETIHYRVTAVNGVNNPSGLATSDGILIDTGTPAAPAEVTENSPDIDWSVDGSVSVFWSGVSDTGSNITYELQKRIGLAGSWQTVPGAGALPSATTSFPDSGSYLDGTQVTYRVRATNGAGISGAWRESDGMTVDNSPPPAPAWVREENPDVDFDPDGQVTVYWNPVTDIGWGITYRLEREISTSPGNWSVVATLAGTSLLDPRTHLDGETIHYRVTTINGIGQASSPTASDGVLIDTQSPAAPGGLGEGDMVGSDDIFDQDNTFFVFWTAVSGTGSDIVYDIQKSVNGGNWVAADTGVTGTSWDDPVPYSNGDTVRYRVRAVNGAALESAWSSPSSGITLDFVQPDSAVATQGFYNAFNWPGFILGSSSDSGSDVVYVDIQIQRRSDNQYWNGTSWGAALSWLRTTGAVNWQYTLALAALSDGITYDVRSRATDNAGNVEATFGTNSFTFASSGPGAPVVSSPTHPVQTNWYNQSNPVLNWTAPSSGVTIVGYSHVLDQVPGTTPDQSPETAGNTAMFNGVSDGTWYFHVRAQDSANNWGPAAHFRLNIDTTTPAAPDSVTEESPDVDWDADGNVTIYWNAVTNTGSGITYRLEQQIGAGPWTLVISTTATSQPVTGLTNGQNVHFRVRASNGVGLNSGYTSSDGVTIDTTTPPAPANVGEGDAVGVDDDWDQDNTFFVYWTAVPNTPSGITYIIERSRNSGPFEVVAMGVTGTSWNDPTAYATGESVAYRVTAATGAGRSGLASSSSDGLTLDFVRPDSVVGTSGFYNAVTWPGSIQGTATDDLSDVAFVDITLRRRSDNLYWNGTGWGATPTWLRTTGAANWQYAFAPSDGITYDIQSRATDTAGNVETTLGAGSFSYVSNELAINLADGRETIQPGERITYTISYYSPFAMNNGRVQIDIPANTTFVNASSGYVRTGDTLYWFLPPQQAGFSGERQLVVDLPPVLDNGLVISTTAYIIGDGQSNSATAEATVVSSPNLTTSIKTVSNPGAAPGGLVTYQIVLSNTGNMHAYNTIITDVIPVEMSYTGTVTASVGTPTFVGGVIGWQGEVRVGTPVTISFKAQVGDAVAAGTIIQNVVDINDGFNPGLIQKIANIAVGSQAPAVQAIYLPFITRGSGGSSTPPTGPDVELTIRNCGDVNAVGAFWVDLYFNPNEQSVFWPIGHGEGYDWFGQGAGFVVSTLGPGQSVSLHLADAVVKNIPNPLPSSARLYAQVDLFDNATPGMGVVDEGPNGEANNVAGSNGRTCSATAGKPDLIVESIKLVGTSSAAAASTAKAAQVEGVAVAPARVQPPQH